MQLIKSLLTTAVLGMLLIASSVLVLAGHESGPVVRVLSDVVFYSAAGEPLGSASEYLSQIDSTVYTYAFSQTGVLIRSSDGRSYIVTNAVCVSPQGLHDDAAKSAAIDEMKAAFNAASYQIRMVVYGVNEVKVAASLVGADATLDCAVLVTDQEIAGQPATIQSSRAVMVEDAVTCFCYSSKPYTDSQKTGMLSAAGTISAVTAVAGIDTFASSITPPTDSSDGPLFLADGTMAGLESSVLSAKSNGRMAVQGDRIAEFLGSLKLTFSYVGDSRPAFAPNTFQSGSVLRTGLIVLGVVAAGLALVLLIRATVKRSSAKQTTKPGKAEASPPGSTPPTPHTAVRSTSSYEDATTVLGGTAFTTLGSSSDDSTSVLRAPAQITVPVQPAVPARSYAGGTTLFVPDEEEGLGGDVDIGEEKGAVIIRRKNYDRIRLSKPMFRVGKDATRVDYCISDNPAISRSHAVFVRKGKEYYLIDNRTTNHTYLNGTLVPPNVETRLADGCVIRMADEDFDFQLV